MPYNIRITYFGNIRSIASWSKVARELLFSLVKKDIKISIYETKGFLYNQHMSLGSLERYISRQIGDVLITFEHPSKYPFLPHTTKKIGFLVYEFTTLPPLWVKNINRYLDLVLVPSKFTYDVFVNSKVDTTKLKILPYGYNPKYYYPKDNLNQDKKIRRFLTISSPHRREALDVLLECFYKAFKDIDDVELTVKLSYLPFKKTKHFEISDFKNILNSFSLKLRNKLKIISDKLEEEEMGKLYREHDLYISLSKAESFGLGFLEAIACSLPVITTKYSAQAEFLSDKNAVFIRHDLKVVEEDVYEKTQTPQYAAYADKNDCIDKLREIYHNGFRYEVKPPPHSTWDDVSSKFIEIIKEMF